MLLDQGQRRLWTLYGPGGVGRSRIVSMILRLLGNAACSIQSLQLITTTQTARYTHLTTQQMLASSISGHRGVLANGVNLDPHNDQERLNIQLMKALVGGESSINETQLQCNVIACMATLVANRDPHTFTKPEHPRRIVVILTVSEHSTSTDCTSSVPTSPDNMRELVHAALATRLHCVTLPMEIDALISTIFQRRYNIVWKLIRYNESVSMCDAIYTNSMLYAKYGILSIRNLSSLLQYIGGEHIFTYNGYIFINHITAIVPWV